MLKQLDLCSGVGAGFPAAGITTNGFELVGLCDLVNDKEHAYIRDILHKRFPGVATYHDVKDRSNWESWNGDQPDIISASPPCPPFSVDGKQLGADDPRDCLPAVLCAIAILQPKFAVIENVPGLFTCPTRPGELSGSYFRGLLQIFDTLGYNAEWTYVHSAYFGTPWVGERLLLVATSRGIIYRQQPTPWYDQIRAQMQTVGTDEEDTSSQPRILRGGIRITDWMDRPLGIEKGSTIVRKRRQAIGNCLDPRLAAIALRRVLYLNQLTQ